MPHADMQRCWRRLDVPGIEVLWASEANGGLHVTSALVDAGADAFGATYTWRLDRDWRTERLDIDVVQADRRTMTIQRRGPAAWSVDGRARPDLDGCDELDVSATPFCNTLAIRRLARATGELTAAYVALPALTVTPSRQRYEAVAPRRWRYVDLGAVRGFTALLDVDDEDLVVLYEGLFEALAR